MPARAAIRALSETGDLRTWSLIVTIFGDMARAPGDSIPGPVLSDITARIGVKPEAMRVALHRLRKDGWIASRRAGRQSQYHLTEAGRAQSQEATARIFARAAPAPERWHIAIAGPMGPGDRLTLEAAMARHLPLTPGAWLGQGAAPADLPPGLLLLEGAAITLPDWLTSQLMPEDLAACYRRFATALDRAEAALASATQPFSPLDRTAIRILLVHNWRRLVLRHPDLPDVCFPADWPGPDARNRLHRLLDTLGQPTLTELTELTPKAPA